MSRNLIQILIGPPGSGKSTFALEKVKKDKNTVVLSRDAYRKMLRLRYENGNEKLEKVITSMLYSDLQIAMNKNCNIIVDNTHCRVSVIIELVNEIKKNHKASNYSIDLQFFDVDLKELRKRNVERDIEKAVPFDVIDRMYENFQKVNCTLGKNQIYEAIAADNTVAPPPFDKNLSNCVIVDIDGTVAHMNGKRGPFEWHNVDRDDPDPIVINLVYTLSQKNKIIFMSGRDSAAREKTVLWLDTYLPGIPYQLFMRPEGDGRKDSIIKRELYDAHIVGKYNVNFVLDDRQQVVDMWRNELGLKVLQVAPGDF